MTNQHYTENILRTQLIWRNGLYLNKENNKPFTGMAIELDRNENNPLDLSKTISRIEYKNGKRHGSYKYFHKNGQLMFRGNYKNGHLHGPFEGFHHYNGQLIETGDYKNGNPQGPWQRFDAAGNLVSSQVFKNGAWMEYEFDEDQPFLWMASNHFIYRKHKRF